MTYIGIIFLGFAIGVSPFKNSGLVNFLINLTGG
jgi:hypothetical protein